RKLDGGGGGKNSAGGKPCQQAACLAEPRPFAAAKIDRHGRLLGENLARPFASLRGASLRLQEERGVGIGFGDGGNARRRAKQGVRLLGLSSLRVGPSQQALGAMEVVVGIRLDGALQVRGGGRG